MKVVDSVDEIRENGVREGRTREMIDGTVYLGWVCGAGCEYVNTQ
jgi:hypothetical protein